MEFNKLIKQRASIRDYLPKKIDISKILNAIEAANLAPSPGNLQILRYIIVGKPETINKISEACRQEFIKKAPVVVVVCSDKANTERMYDKRAEKYIKHHTGASIENFLLKITDMGLASCWVGAFSELTIKNILKIPENIEVEVILPIARPLKTTKQKPKPPLEPRVFFETWKNKFQKLPRKIRGH